MPHEKRSFLGRDALNFYLFIKIPLVDKIDVLVKMEIDHSFCPRLIYILLQRCSRSLSLRDNYRRVKVTTSFEITDRFQVTLPKVNSLQYTHTNKIT